MRKIIENAIYISEPNGKSHYKFNCPFCNNQIILYCWNGHKKCKCGIKFSLWNNGRCELNAMKE